MSDRIRWKDEDYRHALALLKGYVPLRDEAGRYERDNAGRVIYMRDRESNAAKMFTGLTNKNGFDLSRKLSPQAKSTVRKLNDILTNTVGNPLRHYTLVTTKSESREKVLKQVTGIKSKHVKAYPLATIPNLPVKVKILSAAVEIDYTTTGTKQTLIPVALKKVFSAADFDREEIESTDEFADAYIGAAVEAAKQSGVKIDGPNVRFRMLSEAGDITTEKYELVDNTDFLVDAARILFDRYFGDDVRGILDSHAAHRLSGISVWDNTTFRESRSKKKAAEYMDHASHTFTAPKKSAPRVLNRRTSPDGKRFKVPKRRKKK